MDAAEEASTLHRVLAIMCIFFELIRKGSCSRIGLALFPKELMSTTFPLPQSLPLDSEEMMISSSIQSSFSVLCGNAFVPSLLSSVSSIASPLFFFLNNPVLS